MERIRIDVEPEEAEALNFIKERLPTVENYQGLLSLVNAPEVTSLVKEWKEGAIVVLDLLRGIYKQELYRTSENLLINLMENLDGSVDDFASEVQKTFPDLDKEKYAQGTRDGIFGDATEELRKKGFGLMGKMKEEVLSGDYLQHKEVLGIGDLLKFLETLGKKAKFDVVIPWEEIARYGLLRATSVMVNGEEYLATNERTKQATRDSLELAKKAAREVKDRDSHKELRGNISCLDKTLREILKIDMENVLELTTTLSPEERRKKFTDEYKRETRVLEGSNQRLMNEIYRDGAEPNPAKHYQLIVSLFKEALLHEAVGDKGKAKELCDDVNGEFEDFVIEDPRLLLRHYQDFQTFCESLEITLKEDFTEKLQERIDGYQAAQKEEAKAKGWLGRLVGGNDNPIGFITGQTLAEVMGEYQKRFALDNVKTEIMISDDGIQERKNVETIVGTCVNSLMLAEMERRMLERWGITMKEGETYSRRVSLQNPDYMERVAEIGTQIQRVSDELAEKRLKKERKVELRAKLEDLQHAMYELSSGAMAIDESEIDDFKEAVSSGRAREEDLVQIGTTLTEKDIGGYEGLVRYTFIEGVINGLRGKGIVLTLDEATRNEGVTTPATFNVEDAWGGLKAAIPSFGEMEKQGIHLLAAEVGGAFLQEKNPKLLAGAIVDRYFEGYQERTLGQKLTDTLAEGWNKVKLLKAETER